MEDNESKSMAKRLADDLKVSLEEAQKRIVIRQAKAKKQGTIYRY